MELADGVIEATQGRRETLLYRGTVTPRSQSLSETDSVTSQMPVA